MPRKNDHPMQLHAAPPAPCAAQQLQRTAQSCWQLLLQHRPLATALEPELLARCTRDDADRKLSRSFLRWKSAVRRRNKATLRWAASGLSERLFRADPTGDMLSRALSLVDPILSQSREVAELGHLFALHRAFAEYRSQRSRLVARYAHVVEQLLAASQIQPEDFEDTLHDGIVRLAAAPAAYRADRSDSFEAFAREWLAQELGLRRQESAA